MTQHHRKCITALGTAALALAAHGAWAQQMYRHVAPDGRVSYSDQPPVASSSSPATAGSARPGTAGATSAASAALPYELQQTASRYPVVLYTDKDCAPCAAARTMLNQRGIPFTERTVSTNQDTQALQRISGESSLPFATIGAQQLKGYAEIEWAQYLDAAGYPKTSQLPPGYRQTAASPLVAVQAAPAANTSPAATAAPTQPARPTPLVRPGSDSVAPRTSPSNIQF